MSSTANPFQGLHDLAFRLNQQPKPAPRHHGGGRPSKRGALQAWFDGLAPGTVITTKEVEQAGNVSQTAAKDFLCRMRQERRLGDKARPEPWRKQFGAYVKLD
jgi:hypothetical protein